MAKIVIDTETDQIELAGSNLELMELYMHIGLQMVKVYKRSLPDEDIHTVMYSQVDAVLEGYEEAKKHGY